MNPGHAMHVAADAAHADRLAIFFHPLFSDGGVERTNIILGKGLLERGYRVEFLTTRASDHYRREVAEAGIAMVELGTMRTLSSIPKVRRYLQRAARSAGKVYFISCQYYVNVVAMLLAISLWGKRGNIRFIASERNHFSEFQYRKGLKSRLLPMLVRRLYRFADVVVANSIETALDLQQFIGRPVHCSYNPAVNERLQTLRNEPLVEDWFLADQRRCVIAIGRLSAQKDFATLLGAFNIVRGSVDAKLVILGEGEQRPLLERRTRELRLAQHVYLPGFVRNPYKFLAHSSVFVLSSRYEGLPNALIEAVALGIPAVSTACKSGPREILLEGAGGYLVPVADEAQLAAAIITTLEHPTESRAKAAAALLAVDRFSEARATQIFAAVVNQ